jgi:uncharacterized Rmd1/YagE family protein
MSTGEPRALAAGTAQAVARHLPGARSNGEMRALLIGGRIDTRNLAGFTEAERLGSASGEDGAVFVFRFGAVVVFGASAETLERILAQLRDHVVDALETAEIETALIESAASGEELVHGDGRILLREESPERLLLCAIVLARSVVLARDEAQVAEAFERIDPLLWTLRTHGRAGMPIRQVMRHIGDVLSVRHRLIGRVQVGEKPDLLWDHPELERLYARLETEYELDERALVIDRKLDAIGDAAEVLLDLVQEKRSVRLELAIIALIAFEIALTLYEKLVG